MMVEQLRRAITEEFSDVFFTHSDKRSGVTSEVHGGIPMFQAWHGEETKEYESADRLMTDPFFSGKSLEDLAGNTVFSFS